MVFILAVNTLILLFVCTLVYLSLPNSHREKNQPIRALERKVKYFYTYLFEVYNQTIV
ncbi:hypothetical protein [Bacillus sp. JJ722]|uniref:hypothetical protein n=1 Tax=Bacillus sp. JJ722 TaxID=3122973 RepID=UPI002FFEE585